MRQKSTPVSKNNNNNGNKNYNRNNRKRNQKGGQEHLISQGHESRIREGNIHKSHKKQGRKNEHASQRFCFTSKKFSFFNCTKIKDNEETITDSKNKEWTRNEQGRTRENKGLQSKQ